MFKRAITDCKTLKVYLKAINKNNNSFIGDQCHLIQDDYFDIVNQANVYSKMAVKVYIDEIQSIKLWSYQLF